MANRILFVNANLTSGGAEKIIVWLANNFSQRGYDVFFVTYRDLEEDRHLLNENVHRIRLETEIKGHNLVSAFRTIVKLRNTIRSIKCDCAIAFLSPSQLRLRIASIGTKTSLIFSQRGDPYQQSIGGLKKMPLRLLSFFSFNFADYYVFQTRSAQAYYSKRIIRKSVIICNPIKPEQVNFFTDEKKDKSIVTVSRLDIHQKRQDLLIKSFMLIKDEFPDYSLIFYGDGPDREKLEQMASGCENIIFKGYTNDVVGSISNSTAFVLTSDFEGTPNALIEAMACELPCVSTNCSPGGAAELIDNYVNGILVDCGDCDAIAEAMRFIINHPFQARNMGIFARESLGKYEEKGIFDMWENIVRKTIQE